MTRIKSLERMHREKLAPFRSDPRFTNIRQTGTITAFDLNVAASGYLSDVGPRLRAFFRERDLLIRPLGNVIYLMTPYCVTPDDLHRAYTAIDEAADMIA
jgi:adenosylmethionine-8-amino-7-oxononanoate aminotransferase